MSHAQKHGKPTRPGNTQMFLEAIEAKLHAGEVEPPEDEFDLFPDKRIIRLPLTDDLYYYPKHRAQALIQLQTFIKSANDALKHRDAITIHAVEDRKEDGTKSSKCFRYFEVRLDSAAVPDMLLEIIDRLPELHVSGKQIDYRAIYQNPYYIIKDLVADLPKMITNADIGKTVEGQQQASYKLPPTAGLSQAVEKALEIIKPDDVKIKSTRTGVTITAPNINEALAEMQGNLERMTAREFSTELNAANAQAAIVLGSAFGMDHVEKTR